MQESTSSRDEAVRYTSTVGPASVFQEETCKALDEIAAQCGQTGLRPCITFSFPTWGSQCLFSMHICNWAENYFVRELFGHEVEWVDGARRITPSEGATIVVPTEFTFEGAQEGTILKIFGSEFLNGVKESLIRGQEVRQGRHKTSCVWMRVVDDGAVINIALGLERGAKLWEKLIQ